MTTDSHQRARKRFGQNFLHDRYVIEKIIHAIAPQPDQVIVEIGPGKGAITRLLLPACKTLHVIEIDRDLVHDLQAEFGDSPNLEIHNYDALQVDYCQLTDEQSLRLVGNLPYNISTPLLFHIVESMNCIHDMYFMLQKEVVNRLSAQPGSKTYGRLSIMMQYYCQVESLFDVAPGSFTPAPNVNSSIVKLTPHHNRPVTVRDVNDFRQLVTQAFNMRRKTLRNALKKLLSEAEIAACDVDPTLRPEMLTIQDYARLSDAVSERNQVE
jgi:16S rRNA (adenine1518-N6/adenine1519-N6)-dimethyltransferase